MFFCLLWCCGGAYVPTALFFIFTITMEIWYARWKILTPVAQGHVPLPFFSVVSNKNTAPTVAVTTTSNWFALKTATTSVELDCIASATTTAVYVEFWFWSLPTASATVFDLVLLDKVNKIVGIPVWCTHIAFVASALTATVFIVER